MKLHHKAAAAVLSTGLIFGSVGLVSAESASAATTNCVPQDQAVGAANAREAQAELHAQKTKKRVKKAKKANKRHHTKASKKHLKKTKKLNRKAKATLKARNTALALARAAAATCHAGSTTAPTHPVTGSTTPVTPQQITNEITKVINGLGLPAADIQPLIDALTAALTPLDGLTQGQLSDLLGQVTSLLSGGADASTLTDAIGQLSDALTGAGIPSDQLLSPIEGLLSGLAGSGLSADALNDIASQLTSSLGGAGLTDGQVSQVVGQVLGQLGLNTQPTDPTQLLSVVAGTTNTVVSDLGLNTLVAPSAITDLTNGLQGTLDQLSSNGGLLSGLSPITGGILGLL